MRPGLRSWRPAPTCSSTSNSMSAWESTRMPSLRKPASCSIIALRNSSESPILSSSAIVLGPSYSVDWSLPIGTTRWPSSSTAPTLTHSSGLYLELLELRPRVGAREAPVDGAFGGVALGLPRGHLPSKRPPVGDAALSQALAREHREFCLG